MVRNHLDALILSEFSQCGFDFLAVGRHDLCREISVGVDVSTLLLTFHDLKSLCM